MNFLSFISFVIVWIIQIITERYYEACKVDTCKEKRTACDSLASFAEACKHAGKCIDWRNVQCG